MFMDIFNPHQVKRSPAVSGKLSHSTIILVQLTLRNDEKMRISSKTASGVLMRISYLFTFICAWKLNGYRAI